MDRSVRCVVYRMSRLEVLRKIRLRSALKGLGLHFKQPPILEYVMKNDAVPKTISLKPFTLRPHP